MSKDNTLSEGGREDSVDSVRRTPCYAERDATVVDASAIVTNYVSTISSVKRSSLVVERENIHFESIFAGPPATFGGASF